MPPLGEHREGVLKGLKCHLRHHREIVRYYITMEKRKAEVPEGAECPQRGGLDSRRLDAIWVVGVEK